MKGKNTPVIFVSMVIVAIIVIFLYPTNESNFYSEHVTRYFSLNIHGHGYNHDNGYQIPDLVVDPCQDCDSEPVKCSVENKMIATDKAGVETLYGSGELSQDGVSNLRFDSIFGVNPDGVSESKIIGIDFTTELSCDDTSPLRDTATMISGHTHVKICMQIPTGEVMCLIDKDKWKSYDSFDNTGECMGSCNDGNAWRSIDFKKQTFSTEGTHLIFAKHLTANEIEEVITGKGGMLIKFESFPDVVWDFKTQGVETYHAKYDAQALGKKLISYAGFERTTNDIDFCDKPSNKDKPRCTDETDNDVDKKLRINNYYPKILTKDGDNTIALSIDIQNREQSDQAPTIKIKKNSETIETFQLSDSCPTTTDGFGLCSTQISLNLSKYSGGAYTIELSGKDFDNEEKYPIEVLDSSNDVPVINPGDDLPLPPYPTLPDIYYEDYFPEGEYDIQRVDTTGVAIIVAIVIAILVGTVVAGFLQNRKKKK